MDDTNGIFSHRNPLPILLSEGKSYYMFSRLVYWKSEYPSKGSMRPHRYLKFGCPRKCLITIGLYHACSLLISFSNIIWGFQPHGYSIPVQGSRDLIVRGSISRHLSRDLF